MTASIRGPVSDAKELTECKRLSLKRGNPCSRHVAAAAGQPPRYTTCCLRRHNNATRFLLIQRIKRIKGALSVESAVKGSPPANCALRNTSTASQNFAFCCYGLVWKAIRLAAVVHSRSNIRNQHTHKSHTCVSNYIAANAFSMQMSTVC